MEQFYVEVGETVEFSKTVGETDVYGFAGITGDLAPNHVNEEYMRQTSYGTRIAHGALLVGYMSTASTILCDRSRARGRSGPVVSLGYDRIRFVKAVRLGDTITVKYTITKLDRPRCRAKANIVVTNQYSDVVAVAAHILKWVEIPESHI